MSVKSHVLRRFVICVGITLTYCALALAQQRGQKVQSGKVTFSGVIYFRLEANAIYPEAVTVTEGRYLIRLFNHAVPGSVTVQLEDSKNARLSDKAVKKGSNRFSEMQDLAPGTYTLRVVGNPKWVSTLTVTRETGK